MIPAWSDPKHQYFNDAQVQNWISKYHVGGIIFFQGGPLNQIKYTNLYQSQSKIPLLIGMDAEWSLSMRLDSTILYPRQMTLGAIQDKNVINEFARESARQLKRLGVHFSFSPVVDINNNPKNPVISNRSFGEDRDQVLEASMSFMQGLQSEGVLACAKHFPGHGDTNTDSHEDMPVIPFSKSRLDSLELYPYKPLFKSGLASVMVGHLSVPVLEKRSGIPASLSKSIVTDLLRNEMGFQGLVFTDALNMQGVAKHFQPGDMEAMAIEAGNDVLLFPSDIPMAIAKIKKKIQTGEITKEQIKQSCYKILQTKEWCHLQHFKPISAVNVWEDINGRAAVEMNEKVVAQSLVLVKNDNDGLLKLQDPNRKKVLVIVGADTTNNLSAAFKEYTSIRVLKLPKELDSTQYELIQLWLDGLESYDDVVFAWLNTSNRASKNFGIAPQLLNWIAEWKTKSNKWLLMMANPYALSSVGSMNDVNGIVVGFQDDPITERIVAEACMGARGFNGTLPVGINPQWKSGWGISSEGGKRLSRSIASSFRSLTWVKSKNPVKIKTKKYTENYMDSQSMANAIHTEIKWKGIDSLANLGIAQGAYPGCRVLVAHKGRVVYDRGYGYLDEKSEIVVTDSSIYDLASITKLAASSLAMMWLVDHDLLDVNQTLGHYLTFPKKSPYAKLHIKDIMLHQAGLKEFIPFHQSLDTGLISPKEYSKYQLPVAKNMFADSAIYSWIRAKITSTALYTVGKSKFPEYKYSDLGYYFLREIAEKQTKRKWEDFLNEEFYSPMNLTQLGYNPRNWSDTLLIAPTERDTEFRKQLVYGYVHDQGAALMGGVAGHAGLFSNAYDLANVMFLLCEHGKFGNHQFIQSKTVDMFNYRHHKGNRRGLIFDKPSLDHAGGSASPLASESSFGHTGFTGTMCWADPENDIIFIFLSNRIHPSAENKKLLNLSIRTKMHTEVYQQILGTH